MPEWICRTVEDIEAFEKVPFEQRATFFNTYDLLKQGAAVDPDSPAISLIKSGDEYEKCQIVTYGEFINKVNRTANMFHALGLGPQDVVSYLLPNLPQTFFVIWGGEAAGIVNPINPMLEVSTIADICQAAGTKILVALGDVSGSEIWDKAQRIREKLPDLKAVVRVNGSGPLSEGTFDFEQELSKQNGDGLTFDRQISPSDTASLYHTGGTTGRPKLAPRSHLNESFMAFSLSNVLDFKAGDTSLCGLPLFHANGTTITGSVPFSLGGHVVLLSPSGYRDPTVIKNFYKIVEHYKAVTFSSVPTILGLLTEVPPEDCDISSLRYVMCGAAPLSVELFEKFEKHARIKIREGYGLTEGTCVSSVNPYHGRRKIGSIGIRVPYQEMKSFILDEDGQYFREAKTNEIGVIHLRGPNVFQGYVEDEHNQGIWTKEGWFNTGDLGRQDEDGYFWLTGRRKELIIRGGHNIDPASIETPCYSIPEVALAAAVGRPDGHAGEVPVAYVQLRPGADLQPEQILDLLKEKIGERAAIPKEVILIDEIPLTPVGKIFKPKLRWDAIRRVYTDILGDLDGSAEAIKVEVGEDETRGTLAKIEAKPTLGVEPEMIEERVRRALADFTIPHKLKVV